MRYECCYGGMKEGGGMGENGGRERMEVGRGWWYGGDDGRGGGGWWYEKDTHQCC